MTGLTQTQRDEVASIVDERVAAQTAVTDEDGQTWSLGRLTESFGLTRRQALVAAGVLAGGGTLLGALARSVEATSHGSGSIGTEDNPVSAIYVDELFQETDNLDVGTLAIDTISGGVAGVSDITSLVGNGLFVSNNDLQVTPDVLQDGDGTGRDVWIIANGASDPSGASSGDLIFEEEA